MPVISYRRGNKLPLEKVIELFPTNALGELRPLSNKRSMADIIKNANLVISVWDGDWSGWPGHYRFLFCVLLNGSRCPPDAILSSFCE